MRITYSLYILGILFSSLILSACGGGSGGSSGPGYSVSTTTLNFTTTIDGATPDTQDVVFKAGTPQNEYPSIIWDFGTGFLSAVDEAYPDDRTLVLTVHVIPPKSAGLGTHTTTIEVSNSLYDVVINVNYNVTPPPPGEPKVSAVSPYADVSGQAQEVVIGGSGFSRFSDSNLPQVNFGSTPATSVTVVSDTELRAAHPALSAGDYPVQVSGANTSFTSTAVLKVFDYPALGTYTATSSGVKTRLIYDVERSAMYVANKGLQQIERYRFANNSWTMDTLSIPSLQDITLTADGSQLIAVDGMNFLKVDFSGDTLNEISGTPVTFGFANYTQLNYVHFTSTGKVVSTGGSQWIEIYLYDPGTETYQALSDVLNQSYYSIYMPTMWGNWDGSRFFLAENGSTTTNNFLYYPGTQTVSAIPLSQNNFAAYHDFTTDRSGDINVLDATNAYDSNFSLLTSLGSSGDIAAISPDGTTVYVYTQSTGVLKVETLALNNNLGTVGMDNVITSTPGSNPLLTLSLDGKTLFFADSNSVMILPVSSLQ